MKPSEIMRSISFSRGTSASSASILILGTIASRAVRSFSSKIFSMSSFSVLSIAPLSAPSSIMTRSSSSEMRPSVPLAFSRNGWSTRRETRTGMCVSGLISFIRIVTIRAMPSAIGSLRCSAIDLGATAPKMRSSAMTSATIAIAAMTEMPKHPSAKPSLGLQ